ncbi:hypothetical protein [Herbaspirillum huttiense]|uniref:Uncharacterized protein n=2 Tax=Herbaspirillum huttiense TaxID=863372 RepID=A0AAJ2HD72_9BURK|nr:hypothetical protein [Herbaspirillum huttiense]MDR9839888.1 hypothetical protein [Herbaspirillum huttiense]
MAIQIDDQTLNHIAAQLLVVLSVASMLGGFFFQVIVFFVKVALERRVMREWSPRIMRLRKETSNEKSDA